MNRDGGGKPRRQSVRAGRQLTEEEVELWHQLGRSLDKVKKKPRVTAHSDITDGKTAHGETARNGAPTPPAPVPEPCAVGQQAEDRPHRQSGVGPRASQGVSSRLPVLDTGLPKGRPAAPAEIDRRTHRQVAAGKVPIDAVLDLHGLNQEVAHSRLRGFLMGCQANGHRMVLVITGKGAKAAKSDDWLTDGSQGGVLRRNVPLWLDDPELRAIVVSYAAAGVRHGGEGALYIRLRKAREG
jgi:DNA-nicking Smr family endonuclease